MAITFFPLFVCFLFCFIFFFTILFQNYVIRVPVMMSVTKACFVRLTQMQQNRLDLIGTKIYTKFACAILMKVIRRIRRITFAMVNIFIQLFKIRKNFKRNFFVQKPKKFHKLLFIVGISQFALTILFRSWHSFVKTNTKLFRKFILYVKFSDSGRLITGVFIPLASMILGIFVSRRQSNYWY